MGVHYEFVTQQTGHVTYSWQTKSIQTNIKSFLIQVVNIQIAMRVTGVSASSF